MKRLFAVIALSAVMPLAGAAQAQSFPDWPLRQTCKSGDNSCARFEQSTRGQISGVWKTLPPKQRANCVAETQKIEKSYRLLQNCLANAMKELLRDQHRKPPSGKVVHMTPKAKIPAPPPPPPPPAPEPAPPPPPPAPEPVAPPPPPPAPEPAAPPAPEPAAPAAPAPAAGPAPSSPPQ